MQVQFKSVTVETVSKGANKFQKATVNYTYNGQTRQQSIMSFANPTVFKLIQSLEPNDMLEVEVTKNDQGYNQWAKVTKLEAETVVAAPAAPGTTTPVTHKSSSTYETAEERKIKQLYIIRQSSISNAIDYLTLAHEPATVEHVLGVAQQFVDFVYGNNETLATSNTVNEDVPY
jgi:hypothetical protein